MSVFVCPILFGVNCQPTKISVLFFHLAQGSLKPHPMTFEFESRNKNIFFPTRHVHDGEVHPAEDFELSPLGHTEVPPISVLGQPGRHGF